MRSTNGIAGVVAVIALTGAALVACGSPAKSTVAGPAGVGQSPAPTTSDTGSAPSPTPAASPTDGPATMSMPMTTSGSTTAAAPPHYSVPAPHPTSTTAPHATSAPPPPPPPSTTRPPQAAAITISGFAFSGPISVAPGQSITVHNADPVPHTVTADNGAFDVAVPAGGTVTFHAPTTPGSYSYHCAVHPMMAHQTITVT